MADIADPALTHNVSLSPDSSASETAGASERSGASQLACPLPGCGVVNVGEGERLASFVGGVVFAVVGMNERSWLRWLFLAIGGSLLYRSVSGHCYGYQAAGIDTSHRNQHGVAGGRGTHVGHAIVVDRPADDLFDTWKHFDRLPHMLSHVSEVRNLGNHRTHWVATTPFGLPIHWDAQSIVREDARTISWRSEPGSPLQTAGTIRFNPVGQKTELLVSMDYDLPGGSVTERVAEWFHAGLKDCVIEDLREFKRRVEAGEMPTWQE